MKLTLFCLVLVVAVAVVHSCNSNDDCPNGDCHHGLVGVCVHNRCVCEHDHKKRDGGCMSDDDCVGTDCTHLPGSTPYCNHHGPDEHGHSNCECR